MLDNCSWSLFINDETYASSRILLNELSNTEYSEFISQHVKNLDSVPLINCSTNNDHTNGYPFDEKVYSDVSFRVISETQMFNRPIISEKTWITIVNRQPFIMSGYPQSLQYLKQSGYRTFDNYLPIPDYDSIADQEQQLDAVVKNTKFWIDNIHAQEKEIATDVEYNYQLLLNNITKSIEQAQKLAINLQQPDLTPYNIIPLGTEHNNWMLFYYKIKDPQWPDCFLKESFEQLPEYIKTECMNVFGYQLG